MLYYQIDIEAVAVNERPGDLFRVAFVGDAENDERVRSATSRLAELEGQLGGELALINGPASLPVAVVLAHGLIHRYAAVGVFDPKMSAYVVSAAHGGRFAVGDVIPADDVVEG